MTSARNRHPLLSGNNLWLVLLCLVLVGACASQKSTGGPPKGYEVVGDKPATTKPPKGAPKDTIIPPVDGGIVDTAGKFKHKAVYNVALVLPFFLDSFPTANGGIYPQSRIAADYYRGVQLALDTLKQKGLSLQLHVFDSYPDTYLDELIKSNRLKDMDLIIGPVYNSSMKLMAKYALNVGIPIWSPFSPATDITAQNPYFFIANPRAETYAEAMIQYAIDSFQNENINILYQFTDQEKKYLEVYRSYVKAYNQTIDDSLAKNPYYRGKKLVVNEKFVDNYGSGLPKLSTTDLRAMMQTDKRNVFVVPSMKVPFLVNLLREMYPLAGEFSISIIGSSAMGNDVELQLDYINALDVHYPHTYFLKPGYYESTFYTTYLERFAEEPSEYAVTGFDQMFFLGSVLKGFGLNFRVELANVVFDSWGYGFAMRPVLHTTTDTSATPVINYWDNQHLYMLRVKDYNLEKIR